MKKEFTHLDKTGNASMVDVSNKEVTARTAIAISNVFLGEQVISQLTNGELITKKGAVFQTAIIAGIMAAKKTSDLIPMCHPLGLTDCKVTIQPINKESVEIRCMCKVLGKTGVEMEALTGASIAALTVYDMCKSFGHHIVINETKLLKKTGGKSDVDNK